MKNQLSVDQLILLLRIYKGGISYTITKDVKALQECNYIIASNNYLALTQKGTERVLKAKEG